MQPIVTYADLWEWVLSLPHWQGVLLVIGTSLLVAKAVQVGGDVLIRRVTRRIPGDVDDVVFRSVHPPLYVTVVLAGLYLAVVELGVVPAVAQTVGAVVGSLVVLVWAFALTRMGRRVSTEATGSKHFDRQVVPIFQNVWTAVILAGGGFLLLALWDVDVTPLLASAGIVGVVVGLAARDTIANFFGSIALYFDGTYKVGDYIVLESGERGRVEDISIRSTVIRTRDDIFVTVPNAVLNTATIVNESTPRRDRRVRIPVGVAYGTDVEEVEGILLDVAADEDLVLDSPEPRVRFRGFGDSTLEVELLCWIDAPVLRGRAVHFLNKAVYERFREAGVEIPFPQREVSVSMAADGSAVGFDGVARDRRSAEN
ncbi:MAG: mechanosensitive ion channel family protein [Haloarculaceae archaeon]